MTLPARHKRGPWELLGHDSIQWDQIANYLGWDKETLANFGHEFNIPLQRWDHMHMKGSINYMDCIALYSIIRYAKPIDILELGCFVGTSTFMLLEAMKANALPDAHITSVDIKPLGETWTVHGERKYRSEAVQGVPESLITQVVSDATSYINLLPDNSVDFIFEDTNHTYESTRDIASAARLKLRSSGIIVFHDSTIPEMVHGFKDAGVYDNMIVTQPHSPLGIWRKP